MNRFISLTFIGVLLFIYCQPVPITSRKQLHLIPQSQMTSLGIQSYKQVKDSLKTITGTTQSEEVTRVGKQITGAVAEFLKEKNESDRIKDFKWQYSLFQDSSINAWAMPGGGIGVFTGILPYTQNDTGLAVVMGHEVAHVIAQHGNERMSQLLLVQLGGAGLSVALSQKPEITRQLALAAFGLGSQIGILLPYSRLQESEADRLGLIFMAIAGYNPNAAISFWERMAKVGEGKKPPELLSTHPGDEKRIEDIKKHIPEAMKYYKG